MFVSIIKFLTAIVLIGLPGYSSVAARQSRPIQATSQDNGARHAGKDAKKKDAQKAAEKIDKMFPDGLEHDFGKVPMGIQCKHSFRIVNTLNVPLAIDFRRRS
jgi:hypothetical protein